MEALLVLLFLIGTFLLISAVVMPWVNHIRLNSLRKEISRLKNSPVKSTAVSEREYFNEVAKARQSQQSPSPQSKAKQELQPTTTFEPTAPTNKEKPIIDDKRKAALLKPKLQATTTTTKPALAKKTVPTSQKTKKSFNFEQQIGAKLPVWIGGIALALAGFFLVKYSIDNNEH